MSDELLADLRRVWERAWDKARAKGIFCQDEALLAVARYSAERQRGMEATEEMIDRGVSYALNVTVQGEAGWSAYVTMLHNRMQSAAPLWVDK